MEGTECCCTLSNTYFRFLKTCADLLAGYSCNGLGDYVDYTAQEATATDGCPTDPKKQSCPGNGDAEDPIHNFMDYSVDPCYDGFSGKQPERMRSIVCEACTEMGTSVDRSVGESVDGLVWGRGCGTFAAFCCFSFALASLLLGSDCIFHHPLEFSAFA
jgi:hypothetical protein